MEGINGMRGSIFDIGGVAEKYGVALELAADKACTYARDLGWARSGCASFREIEVEALLGTR